VLSRITEVGYWLAQAEGSITSRRAEQIARHVTRALGGVGNPTAAERPRRTTRPVLTSGMRRSQPSRGD
jgi:hypothetical protein